MTEAGALLVGLALGIWQTWRLRQATRLALQMSGPSPRVLAAGFARRLLPSMLLLGLLVSRSSAASLIALGGYWLGRTLVLAHDLGRLDARS